MLNDNEFAELYLHNDYIKLLIFARITSSLLGIVLLIAMELYREKFVAHKSMKLLMACHAFWTLVLCVSTLVDNTMTAVSHYSASVPEDILLTASQCLPRRLIGAIALYGSVSSMIAMAMERSSASVNFATYERAGQSSGFLHAVVHVVVALALGGVVWATYGSPSRTPHCTIVTPQGQTAMNVINFTLFLMEFATIATFFALLRKNGRTLRQTQFRISLTERYQLSENIRMLKLFLPVVGSHTSITIVGLIGYFAFQIVKPGPQYYPMFEDTINYVYMQGVFMPAIFYYRYRVKRSREKRLFSTNRMTADNFAKNHADAIQKGW